MFSEATAVSEAMHAVESSAGQALPRQYVKYLEALRDEIEIRISKARRELRDAT